VISKLTLKLGLTLNGKPFNKPISITCWGIALESEIIELKFSDSETNRDINSLIESSVL